jgi:hypothetical protein
VATAHAMEFLRLNALMSCSQAIACQRHQSGLNLRGPFPDHARARCSDKVQFSVPLTLEIPTRDVRSLSATVGME